MIVVSFCKPIKTLCMNDFSGINLSIRISSIGNDDAEFDSSESSITIGNELFTETYLFNTKGLHAVVVSAEDGQFVKGGSFNMVDDPNASSKFIAFIRSSPRAAIVLLCIFDDASVHLTNSAIATLSSLGAESNIGFRGSFVLASQKDTLKPTWFKERYAAAGSGPVQITTQIEL